MSYMYVMKLLVMGVHTGKDDKCRSTASAIRLALSMKKLPSVSM